jgi:competence protein CoiA
MSYVECVEALWATGGRVNALRMTPAEWRLLQENYAAVGLLMPCCKGGAVPKVSPNGHQHFAHKSGACSESEESQWHLAAKSAVRATLELIGCQATVDEPGMGPRGRWQADAWGERGDIRIAVEIQRSYQHLRDYQTRQQKYQQAGIRSVWLLRSDRYVTLVNSMRKERHREEFGGKWPYERHEGPCLPDIPVARLELDETGDAKVTGASFFESTLPQMLEAVIAGRFLWTQGLWCIDNLDAMQERMRLVREANQAK